MRIVIALSGNALLRRSDPMTTGVQRPVGVEALIGKDLAGELLARFAAKTGGRAAIGALADIAGIVAGTAGTSVVTRTGAG